MSNVKISNIQLAMVEPEMLAACLEKAMKYEDSNIAIWPKARNQGGWLEWSIDIHSFDKKHKLFLGAIQRDHLANFEFHS